MAAPNPLVAGIIATLQPAKPAKAEVADCEDLPTRAEWIAEHESEVFSLRSSPLGAFASAPAVVMPGSSLPPGQVPNMRLEWGNGPLRYLPRVMFDPNQFVIAGGFACYNFMRGSPAVNDVDIFFCGPPEKAVAEVENLVSAIISLRPACDPLAKIMRTPNTVTVSAHGYKYQIIMKSYESAVEVMRSFDIGACQVALIADDVFMTAAGFCAYHTGVSTVRATDPSTARRVVEYLERGFRFEFGDVEDLLAPLGRIAGPDSEGTRVFAGKTTGSAGKGEDSIYGSGGGWECSQVALTGTEVCAFSAPSAIVESHKRGFLTLTMTIKPGSHNAADFLWVFPYREVAEFLRKQTKVAVGGETIQLPLGEDFLKELETELRRVMAFPEGLPTSPDFVAP